MSRCVGSEVHIVAWACICGCELYPISSIGERYRSINGMGIRKHASNSGVWDMFSI
ncbi:hypothetical protein C8R48DRAFT_713148, partial [Suillus tomentosus]